MGNLYLLLAAFLLLCVSCKNTKTDCSRADFLLGRFGSMAIYVS